MAKKTENIKKFKVSVEDKTYCGIGAGGVQFAYGEAVVHEGWVLDWYKEHGYKVEEIKEDVSAESTKPDTKAKDVSADK